MKILFLTTVHNSLSQRLLIELTGCGHIVDVSLAVSECWCWWRDAGPSSGLRLFGLRSRPQPTLQRHGRALGSEYWTYLLPKRVGQARVLELTQVSQPIGARAARDIGFLDEVFGEDARTFEAEIRDRAKLLAASPEFRAILRKKHERPMEDESIKPLANYRAEELERMKVIFSEPIPPIAKPGAASSSRGVRRRRLRLFRFRQRQRERVSVLFEHTVCLGAVSVDRAAF